jgi:hypothetical protein
LINRRPNGWLRVGRKIGDCFVESDFGFGDVRRSFLFLLFAARFGGPKALFRARLERTV